MRALRSALVVLAALACGACAHTGGASRGGSSTAPAADSITIGLWHLDESGGTYCAEAGPYRMTGTAGIDTRTDFGRIGNARVFTGSNESWMFVPYMADMNSAHLTVEAWIHPDAYGSNEDTPIAGRWTQYPNEQSWLFSVVGLQRDSRLTNPDSPGYHEILVSGATAGRLMFAFQPADPGAPRAYFSTSEVPLGRWTHVAATHDGAVVRFWIDGHLDAQFATRGAIRDGVAPLLVGNTIDTRRLSDFGGQLEAGSGESHPPVYAFLGMIDELRISSQARESFDLAR